jgi:predicted SnoaL-like aldol condensation-catalyzing enzyme
MTGFVQEWYSSQGIQLKLKEYLRNSKLIMNQKTLKTQRAHDQKPQRNAQVQNRRQSFVEDYSPMFKHKCHGTAKIDAWVHVMTLVLIIVARIGMHYAKTWQNVFGRCVQCF